MSMVGRDHAVIERKVKGITESTKQHIKTGHDRHGRCTVLWTMTATDSLSATYLC